MPTPGDDVPKKPDISSFTTRFDSLYSFPIEKAGDCLITTDLFLEYLAECKGC